MPKYQSIGNNSVINSSKSKLKISINKRAGVIFGTTYETEPPVLTVCQEELDFSCEDNSQYIPLI